MHLTDIYRIRTQNSFYEIQVNDQGRSKCRKNDEKWRMVDATTPEYLEKLVIGPSFDVPGVVLTSMVSDYSHFVLSDEPKRTTTPAFFGGLADQIVQQVKGQVRVPDPFDQI
jgi:hypothetical protein